MKHVKVLEPGDIVDGRPFTHPGRIDRDVNTLKYMVDQLSLFFEQHPDGDRLASPTILHRPERGRWVYRLVLARPGELLTAGELTIVGFLGQRRPDADLQRANEFDALLVAEIPEHPGLLSYSTMALISGNYSNLVVFANANVKEQWSGGKAHAQAVNSLSPKYYDSVRLYNGFLPRGIRDSNAFVLTHIKYFDYQSSPNWRAIRVFQETLAQ